MRGNRGSKDKLRSSAARVRRCPAAYDELIRRTGVKGSLGATAGFDRRPGGGGRARAAAQTYRRIPLRLTAAAATRRLHLYRATSVCGDSHGASQHGHGYAQETQPDRRNGCQPTHHPFRPPQSSSVDARPQGKFRQPISRTQLWRRPAVPPEVPVIQTPRPQTARRVCHEAPSLHEQCAKRRCGGLRAVSCSARPNIADFHLSSC
jgi:hypothetical protein